MDMRKFVAEGFLARFDEGSSASRPSEHEESVVSICLTYATGMIYTILSVTVIKGVS